MQGEWVLDPLVHPAHYKHATPKDIEMAGVDVSSYIVATTTRHPLDFYISQYHKKSTRQIDSPWFNLAKEKSFKDFLQLFVEAAPSGMVHPIFIGAADVIFRKECLEADVNEFLKFLGVEKIACLPNIHVSEKLSHEFSDWYDEASNQWVLHKHQAHFERFEYSEHDLMPRGKIEISKSVCFKPGAETLDGQRLKKFLHERYLKQLATQTAVKALNFTFDQPLVGNGWHNREFNGLTYWRFTGPSSEATLFFHKVVPEQAKIRITVFHAITPAHIETLTLSYNGVELVLLERAANVIVFSITEEAIAARAYTSFKIGTLPPQCPGTMDTRLLGVAIQRIEIY